MAKRGANASDQFFNSESFGDVIVSPEIKRVYFSGFIRTAGQYDHRNRRAGRPHLLQHIHTVDIGEAEIEHEYVETIVNQRNKRLVSLRSFGHLVTLGRQARAKKPPDCRLVVYHQNFARQRCSRHAAHYTVPPVGTDTGSSMVKTAPLRSRRLSAWMAPPIAAMKPRQMASPRPVPAWGRS